jgi:hypothetical protein
MPRLHILLVAVVVLVGLAAVSSGASLLQFPHVESADRYAGWVPVYTAARAADSHRVRFYLTPRNLELFDVPSPPQLDFCK